MIKSSRDGLVMTAVLNRNERLIADHRQMTSADRYLDSSSFVTVGSATVARRPGQLPLSAASYMEPRESRLGQSTNVAEMWHRSAGLPVYRTDSHTFLIV